MLARWVVIPALLWLTGTIWFVWPEAELHATSWDYAPAYLTGTLLGGFLFAFIPSWIVWRLTRRARNVGSILFTILLAFTTLREIVPHLIPANLTRLQSSGNFAARNSPRLSRARPAMDGIIILLKSKRKAIDDCMKRYSGAGGLHPESMEEPGVIEKQIDALDDALAAIHQETAAGDAAHRKVAGALDSAGAEPEERDSALQAFDTKLNWARIKPVLDADEHHLVATRAVLEFCRVNRGTWTWPATAKTPTFTNVKVLIKFNDLIAQLHASEAQLKAARAR